MSQLQKHILLVAMPLSIVAVIGVITLLPRSTSPIFTEFDTSKNLSLRLEHVVRQHDDLMRQLNSLQQPLVDFMNVHTTESESLLQHVVQQRNDLSRLTNLLQEKHQQLICQTKNQSSTSETGGWCNTAVGKRHMTDNSLASGLADLFAGKTVVGLGDGRGVYRKLILDTGKVPTYDAYDGAPYIDSVTDGQVHFLDLTLPQYWLPRYDWAMSLEVLEHVPAKFETAVLDNIDRAAGHGVVLSWAVPGQGGFRHINNRPHSYVKQQMVDRGFIMNEDNTEILRKIAKLPWFHANIVVFVRK